MDSDFDKRLKNADCAVGWYVPEDDWETFPYQQYMQEIMLIRQQIQDDLGITLRMHGSVQDASFIEGLSILDESSFLPNGVIQWVCRFDIRFSNFGKLYTFSSHFDLDFEEFRAKDIQRIIEAHDWLYVPQDVLKKNYYGTHKGFIGQTWWTRFFDYV